MKGILYFNSKDATTFKSEGKDLRDFQPDEILQYFDNLHLNNNLNTKNIIDLDDEFAIAIINPKQSEITLIRDVFGIVPLYYLIQPEYIAYSTDIKFLLSLLNFELKPNINRISEYLYGVPAYSSYTEETYFENIFSVIPGQILTIKNGNKIYKNLFNLQIDKKKYITEKTISESFLEILKEAVKKKIEGSKNIATMLSGGIDSSSLTCVASIIAEGKVNSIEVRTNFEIVEERAFAQDVVNKYHLNHTIINSFEDFLAYEIDFVKEVCEPSCFGLSTSRHYEISKLVSQLESDILIEGFGGDEILGMDSLYFNELFNAKKWGKLNAALRQRSKNHHRAFWVNKINEKYGKRDFKMILFYFLISSLKLELSSRIIKKLFKKNKHKLSVEGIFLMKKDESKLLSYDYLSLVHNENNAQHLDYIKTYLNKSVIYYNEHVYKLGKKFNYHYRFPFFSLKLASFIAGCPKEYNFGNGIARFIIRESLKDILPDSIRLRKSKTAFNPLILNIFKQKYPEFIAKYPKDHVTWQYIDRKKFIEMSDKILINDRHMNNIGINFCNKVISLGIWLDVFFEKK